MKGQWRQNRSDSELPYPSPSDPVSLASGGSDGDGNEGKDTDKLRS